MTDAVIAMNEAKKQPGVNRGGRPDKIDQTYVDKAQAWLDGKLWEADGRIVPTVEGLARHLNLARVQMYEAEELKYILEKVQTLQAEMVLDRGLAGEYSAPIAKLVLSKHGYVERTATDVTTSGESLHAKSTSAVALGFAEFAKSQTIEGELVEEPKQLADGDTTNPPE